MEIEARRLISVFPTTEAEKGHIMSILDQLLGGSDQESANANSDMSEFMFGADPAFGIEASDVLHSASYESDDGDVEASEFTGIGDLAIGFSSPVVIGTSSSSESANFESSDGDSGGLLGGLL